MKKFYTIALAAAVAFSVSAKDLRLFDANVSKLPVLESVKRNSGSRLEVAPIQHRAAAAAGTIKAEDLNSDFYWQYWDALEEFKETTNLFTFEQSTEDANTILIPSLGSDDKALAGQFDEATATLTISNQNLGVVTLTNGAKYDAIVQVMRINATGDQFEPVKDGFVFTFSRNDKGIIVASSSDEMALAVVACTTGTADIQGYFFFGAYNALTKDGWIDLGDATFVDGIIPVYFMKEPSAVTSTVKVQRSELDPNYLRMYSPWSATYKAVSGKDIVSKNLEFSIEDPDCIYVPLQNTGFGSSTDGSLYIASMSANYETSEAFFESQYAELNISLKDNVITFAPGAFCEIWSGDPDNIYLSRTLESSLTLPAGWNNGDATAVEEVEVENGAPVEYFNLQGVRVANPENGLYIRRQGKNVTKVLVK